MLHQQNNKKNETSFYKCIHCGLGFEYQAALVKHRTESHTPSNSISTEECGKISNLKKHDKTSIHTNKNNNNNDNKVSLTCPEDNCNLFFQETQSYYSHILCDHRKVYQDDPKFIEFLSTVDQSLLKVSDTNVSTKLKFMCKLCDRKVIFIHYRFYFFL